MTAGRRTEASWVRMSEVSVMGTASAAFSLCGGNRVPQVAVQIQGPGSTPHGVDKPKLQLGSPAMNVCVLCGTCSRLGALLLYYLHMQ